MRSKLRVIGFILMFSILSILFIDEFSNVFIGITVSLLSMLLFVIGISLFIVSFSNKNSKISIAGKVIDVDNIDNLNKVSLWETIKYLNIHGLVGKFLLVIVFFAVFMLIMVDPFNVFSSVFYKVLFLLFIVWIINVMYIYYQCRNVKKTIRDSIVLFFVYCFVIWFMSR